MAYKVIISKRALRSLEKVCAYTIENFGENINAAFLSKVEKAIYTISIQPLLFPIIKDNIHRVLIINEVSMFYQIKVDTIRILLFWNNKQNPDKLGL